VSELWDLVKSYALQETVNPLKKIARFLAFGLGAAVLGSIGIVLLLLALLRGVQAHSGSTFTGNLSWIPYVIVLAVGVVVTVVAISRIGRGNEV
jgi:hypothetical protein